MTTYATNNAHCFCSVWRTQANSQHDQVTGKWVYTLSVYELSCNISIADTSFQKDGYWSNKQCMLPPQLGFTSILCRISCKIEAIGLCLISASEFKQKCEDVLWRYLPHSYIRQLLEGESTTSTLFAISTRLFSSERSWRQTLDQTCPMNRTLNYCNFANKQTPFLLVPLFLRRYLYRLVCICISVSAIIFVKVDVDMKKRRI